MRIEIPVYHIARRHSDGIPECLGADSMDSQEARRIVETAKGAEWAVRSAGSPISKPVYREVSEPPVGDRIRVADLRRALEALGSVLRAVAEGFGEDWSGRSVFVNWADDWGLQIGEDFIRFTIESTANEGIANRLFPNVEAALDFLVERAHELMAKGYSVRLSVTTGVMEAEFTTSRKEEIER